MKIDTKYLGPTTKMSQSASMKKLKIIRKLGNIESIYDNEILNENFLLSRVFRTEIPTELSRAAVSQALEIWVKRHPLLQSCIYRTLDEKSHRPKILLPKYFVYLDKNLNSYDNIEMLETRNDRLWMELIETELKTNFSLENEPLWRMKIVKVLENEASSNHYDFIFTNHHAIGDGRNLYTIMIQFLNILGALLEKKTCIEMNAEIEHSNFCMEELTDVFKSEQDTECAIENFFIDRRKQTNYLNKLNGRYHIYNSLCEKIDENSFMLEELVEKFKAKLKYKSEILNIGFDELTHRMPSSLGDRANGTHGRFLNVYVESFKLEKLIKKMKLNALKCKLTSVLAVLFCMSLRQSYAKYGVQDIPLDSFQFDLLSSLREKFKIKNSQMGVYSVSIKSRLDGEIDKQNLWAKAQSLSLLTHERIKNNEDVEGLSKIPKLIGLIESGYDFFNNQSFNFCLSNIGVMKNTASNLIKVKEHYVAMPTLENRFDPVLFNSISTIDNNLCWGISFNEKVFSGEFVLDLKSALVGLIDEIVNDY